MRLRTSTTTMASIDSMRIRGVRSFSPDDKEEVGASVPDV